MSTHFVRNLCETTKQSLKIAVEQGEQFLNHYALSQLNTENEKELNEFYQDYLSDMRRLLVFCEVSYEKLGNTLRRPKFNQEHAEKLLYDAFHSCVNNFFYPKSECYSEDGRYAYTGQDAIRFRKKPLRAVRDLTIDLSKTFEALREELAYYETDYITQKRMQGQRI